jgi:cytochrome c-type biogenesis protein CcmH
MPRAFLLKVRSEAETVRAVFRQRKRHPQIVPTAQHQEKCSKRLLQIALLCIVSVGLLGAGTPSSSRFDSLGHKLVCVCGCGQILLECNHVGCPDSDRMITELRTQLASGASDSVIFNWFVTKYGPTVLAAPLRGGFDLVAWIVPFAVLFLGLGGVVVLLRVWKRRQAQLALVSPSPLPPVPDSALRDRIRRETEYHT